MGKVVAAISAVTSIVSAIGGASAAKKEAKKAARLEQQREALEARRVEGSKRQQSVEAEATRRKNIRQKFIAQGETLASGAGQGFGLGGTSGVQGNLASISSQANTAIGATNRNMGANEAMADVGSEINRFGNRIAGVQSSSSVPMWQSLGSLGNAGLSNASQIGSIFKTFT
jgi:hypothetical protein